MVRLLIRRISSFITQKQGSILSAAAVIMVTVLLSRIFGLLRDRLLASQFSVDDLGIYFAAFRLPNLLFELLVMGALATAFIPVFTEYLVKNKDKEAFTMAAYAINLSVLVVGICMIPLIIFARQISYFLVPGFSESQRNLMVAFTQIMLVGQLIPLIVGNFVTGMLQSFQRFLLPALAPIVYNLGIIAGVLLFAPSFGLYSAVLGVALGAFLYLAIQVPLIYKLGYRHKLEINYQHPGLKRVIHLMMPRMLGLAVAQIDSTVDLILASFLGSSSITIFYFAQNLQQVPIGLFGATFAQAALPTLSSEGAKKDLQAFKQLFLASLNQILFLVLPASVMLIVLRIPIVRLVFGAARFNWSSTVLTGKTVSFFAISIFAQSLVQLFARGFYALYDTKTPVVIGGISIVINTVLSICFVSFWHLPVWSLAVSTSVANCANAGLLLLFLNKKIAGFDPKALWLPPLKMFLASLVTGVSLYIPLKLLDQLVFDTTRVLDLLILTGIASIIGLSMYIFLAWFLDIEEVATFFHLMQKVRRVPRVFFTQTTELTNDNQSSIS